MNEKQKDLLADKLADLANYAVTALVLGQVIVRPGWRLATVVVGLGVAEVLYKVSLAYRR